MATVSFNSVKQTGCSLVFKPEGGEPEVNIGQIYFPYTFDPVEYGLDQDMIEGEYEFTCEGCVFTKVVNRPEPTTTTTTTSTSTTTTTTLPLFTCDNDGLVLTISDGLVGTTISTAARDTSFTYNGVVLQVNITPSTYQSGYSLYSVGFTVPSGYSNSGQIIVCDVPAVGITTTTSTSTTSTSTTSTSTTSTTTLATFTCEDVILNVSDGILNETVNATVNVGTIASITPTTYQIGSSVYTVGITVPSGYSNSGQIIECTDTAIGEEGAAPTTTTTTTEAPTTTTTTTIIPLHTYYLTQFRLTADANTEFCETSYLTGTEVTSPSPSIPGMLNQPIYDSNGDPLMVAGGRYAYVSKSLGESSSDSNNDPRYVIECSLGNVIDVLLLDCSGGGGGANPL